MSDDVILQVEHLSKKFCRSLKWAMWHGALDIARDTFALRQSEPNLRQKEFWAIDNVSFQLTRGECLGLIGPNGAGKTTLLKLLNGIILPDKGSVSIRGILGVLIQLGAGFHPQLTGRENIYVNGAILNLKRKEIDAKLESIIDFSSIEEFIDTPVKHYSSGMLVRLGFAVAAHLNADILLIDEVLAVGDQAFRDKCYNHIGSFIKRGGSIVLVSHNMVDISRSCDKAIVLDQGKVIACGDVPAAIDAYMSVDTGGSMAGRQTPVTSSEVAVRTARLNNQTWNGTTQVPFQSDLSVELEFDVNRSVDDLVGLVSIRTRDGYAVTCFRTDVDNFSIGQVRPGVCRYRIHLPQCQLLPGIYVFTFSVTTGHSRALLAKTDGSHLLHVLGGRPLPGVVHCEHQWEFCQEEAASSDQLPENDGSSDNGPADREITEQQSL